MTLAEIAQWLETTRPLIALFGGSFLVLIMMEWSLARHPSSKAAADQCGYRRRMFLGWVPVRQQTDHDPVAVSVVHEAPSLY